MHYSNNFKRMNRLESRRTVKGFTLLELAIVMAIIGVIVGGGLVVLTAATQTAQVNATVAKMEVIDKAMLDYATNFGRLPCPSDLTIIPAAINYGVEAATPGTCFSGTPSANFQATTGTVEGGVPTRTLRLPDDYMYDGWGRRIRYAVDPSKTSTSSLPVGAGTCPSTKAITVNDATGTARTLNGAYALISHGANGHGAYTSNGVMFNAGSTNTDQLTNCHCTAAGAPAATYTPNYVQKLPTLNVSNKLDEFDDIVSFKEGWQLQSMNFPLSTTACSQYLYIMDADTHTVRKMIEGGNIMALTGNGYEGTMPAAAASTLLYTAVLIAFDSSGNWYTADASYHIVVKVNVSTGVVSRLAGTYNTSGSSGDGGLATSALLKSPSGIAVDSNNNIYISDTGNHNIRKITAATGIITTIAGNSTGSYNGDGQLAVNAALYSPGSLALDSSNNLYISDTGNYRIRVITASNGMINTVAGAGTSGSTGNGGLATAAKIKSPTYIALDSSGNIYISDTNNNQIRKVTVADGKINVFVNSSYTLGCGGDGGLATSATLHYPNGVAVDAAGNVYLSDYNSYVIRKVSASTGFISTIAGVCGTSAEGGDGGPASTSTMGGVYGLGIGNQ